MIDLPQINDISKVDHNEKNDAFKVTYVQGGSEKTHTFRLKDGLKRLE